jgi:hypothetical protein
MGRRLVVVLGLCTALVGRADEGRFPSVVGGTVVAPRENVVEVGLGHTDLLSVGWRHGVSPVLELGLAVTGTFGYRGTLFIADDTTRGSAFGAKVQARLKVKLLEAGIVSLALSFEPGLSWATFVRVGAESPSPRLDAFGVELPVALKLGLALSEHTTLGFQLEEPFFLEFLSDRTQGTTRLQDLTTFAYGPRAGVGIEHAFSERLLFFAQVRVGLLTIQAPVIDLQLGLAWRLPAP